MRVQSGPLFGHEGQRTPRIPAVARAEQASSGRSGQQSALMMRIGLNQAYGTVQSGVGLAPIRTSWLVRKRTRRGAERGPKSRLAA